MPTPTADSYPGTVGQPVYAGLAGSIIYPVVPNTLTVSLPTGSETNYPLQFGRAFQPGKITGHPEVTIGGTPVAQQQADIKTRHDDGSVKFAVISCILPTINTTPQTLTIGNKAAGAAPTAETIANMLANYDFEASINIALSGVSVAGAPVSARAMLGALTNSALASETTNGGVNSRYWTVGPVCTTVILCDHTTKAYDIGSNATKAIRPMFHVQFWPGINRYKVRHIIEIADVTKLKDELGIDVSFSTGYASPSVRMSKSALDMFAATFHSSSFWGGTTIPRARINHNLSYLSSTGVIPNYDSTIVMNAAAITSYETAFASLTKGLGDSGWWQKAMATTGGRPDIGLFPKWDIVSLYSGAAHMAEIVERHAEMGGSWAFFFREGDAAKTIFGATPGQGRIVSKLSRPTQFMYDGNGNMNAGPTSGTDQFLIDGTLSGSRNGWAHDSAHTPGMMFVPYITTGEAFWHEKLMQLAAWGQWLPNPAAVFNSIGNGRLNTDLVLNGTQTRGFGWQIRNRVRAWWAALDGSPEKSLLNKAVHDPIAMAAGVYDISGFLESDPIRIAWNTNFYTWAAGGTATPRPNALHYWNTKGPYTTIDGATWPNDSGQTAQSPWMLNFVTMCLYHGKELGYDLCGSLGDWTSYQVVQTAAGPKPLHIGDYVFPDTKSDGTLYQTLADLYDGWTFDGGTPASSASGFAGAGAPNTYSVTMEGYSSISAAAVAMANGVPQQAAAWAFIQPYHQNSYYYNHDPRYAIVPRA